MKSIASLFTFIFLLIFISSNQLTAQVTNSSSNWKEHRSSNKPSNGNYPYHKYSTTYQHPPARCYQDSKVWVNGFWKFKHGRRKWIPGHWEIQKIEVPCTPNHHYDCHVSSMSPHDFEHFLTDINNINFESSKRKFVQNEIPRYLFSSSQVREIMFQFTFESDRLEVAKLAYKSTMDKDRYYIVQDAFKFNSSKRQLNQFIRNYF